MNDPRFPGATILPFDGKLPRIHDSAFVAPGACIIGDVTVGAEASIWYNCVLRGDIHRIEVGARSNVQDGTVIHVEGPRPEAAVPTDGLPTLIGEDCVIGHMAIVHAAVVEDGGFVGMGAVVMDGARVSTGAMLGAGALLSPGKVIPPGEIWVGRPARFLRAQDEGQIAKIRFQSARYVELARRHRAALDGQGQG
ncbi:MAG: gamma carbonic anhydrase family protein [Alteraurantiacibacter sp.]|nr:gamma carbonic anhydrase family protein [Alteraurantiacibacter sp.]